MAPGRLEIIVIAIPTLEPPARQQGQSQNDQIAPARHPRGAHRGKAMILGL